MNALTKAMSWLGIPIQNAYPDELPPITSAQAGAGSDFYRLVSDMGSGVRAPTEQTALTISAVYACVNLIAGAIAALPMHIYRRQPDGERDQLHNDDLWWLLNEEFTPRWSAAAGWEYLVQSLLLQGDSFAIIHRSPDGQRIMGLEPVHPRRVTVAINGKRLAYAVMADPLDPKAQPQYEVFDQDDMIHVPGFGFDGLRGKSPLRHQLSATGGVALATQDYAGRFFSNSARPDVVLQTDQVLKPETATEIRDSWEALYRGTQNAHRPAVLGAGVKVQTITMTIEDMQLLGLRQFQIEEIARIYGVPPFMIGHNEKTTSWGSGVEQMGIGFVRYTLNQHLNKFHNEINRKFFRTAAKFAQFDVSELERADTKSMFEAFRAALGGAGTPGFMTQNEVRKRFNLKPVAGGDTLSTGVANAPQQAAQPAGA